MSRELTDGYYPGSSLPDRPPVPDAHRVANNQWVIGFLSGLVLGHAITVIAFLIVWP